LTFIDDDRNTSYRRIFGGLAWPYGIRPGFILLIGEERFKENNYPHNIVRTLFEAEAVSVNELLARCVEVSHYQQSGPRGRRVPGELVTAVRYSGTWREKRYEENKTLLEGFIRRKRFNEAGEEIFARYTSTLMPFFSGRIEVVIPVKPKAP
jgi:hypothetical protein